jgi:protein gp37
MGKNSAIEWCDHTWNPWYGCHKVSAGCKNCYMFRDMQRTRFKPNVVTRAKPATFREPLSWKEPKKIFTCSWSDFWIEEADEWREEALQIIADTPHLVYQILTKRPERILDWLDEACWPVSGCPIGIDGLPDNVWLGISAENQEQYNKRIKYLLDVPCKVRFVSAEPLLNEINLSFHQMKFYEREMIDWVITGGESGPENKIRKAKLDWFRSIRDQCQESGIAFFHKQHGGSRKINGVWGGRELDGRTWDEFPN